MTHLALVGLMGSGKSTVGRRVASRMNRPFVDSDREVERRTGKSVRDLFVERGESEFRRLEAEVMADALSASTPSVVAAAGGAVLDSGTRRLLRDSNRTVFLDASIDRLVERVGDRARTGRGHRPLIDGDPAARLREMDAARRDLYLEVAAHRIEVDDKTLDEVVDEIVRWADAP